MAGSYTAFRDGRGRTEKDCGSILKRNLKKRKNTKVSWDDIALFCYAEQYQLGIYEMEASDVVEIDDLKELV